MIKAERSEMPSPSFQYHPPRIHIWPLGGLFPPPFFLGVSVVWEVGHGAAGFENSAAFTHAPATFTFPARALRRGAEVPDLSPSVGAQGSEQDLDPATRVKAWCLGEELGPVPELSLIHI